MTDQTSAEVIWHRAPLSACAWEVVCPVCGTGRVEIETEEDIAGAILPEGSDAFVQCPDCGSHIEVAGVCVTEAYPA